MVKTSMDVPGILRRQIEDTEPDILRKLMQSTLEILMSAEAEALCEAGYRERSEEPQNYRNGYRSRPLDTRLAAWEPSLPAVPV